eukprot:PhF_6_TR29228/c0_g1_i2/m.42777
MDFLYHRFPNVLRAVTCLAIHDDIVIPMDVVESTFVLYVPPCNFVNVFDQHADHYEVAKSLRCLQIGPDKLHLATHKLMNLNDECTVAVHADSNGHSGVLVTPSLPLATIIVSLSTSRDMFKP